MATQSKVQVRMGWGWADKKEASRLWDGNGDLWVNRETGRICAGIGEGKYSLQWGSGVGWACRRDLGNWETNRICRVGGEGEILGARGICSGLLFSWEEL